MSRRRHLRAYGTATVSVSSIWVSCLATAVAEVGPLNLPAAKRWFNAQRRQLQRRHHHVRVAVAPEGFRFGTTLPAALYCTRSLASAGRAL